MTSLVAFGFDGDEMQRLRREWADNLAEHMKARQMTRKALQAALSDQGAVVSLQAISLWLRAEAAPRATMQGHIAAVFQVPVRSLFPVVAS